MKAVFAGALALAVTAACAVPPRPISSALDAEPGWSGDANAFLEAVWRDDEPGVSVVVARDGRIVYARGRGLADIDDGTPITPDTVFRLGSITKQFTAAVALQLAEEQRLSLDDPLSEFLPAFPEPGATATVRQLLNHTSGVQSYTSIPGWMVEANTDRPYSTDELIAVFKDLPPPAEPGRAWTYNNSGYVLAGAVIEAVTDRPWHEAVEARIALPHGLETLDYGGAEPGGKVMATGYTRGADGPQPAGRIHPSAAHAAGSLIGSAPDLARWAQALHNGGVLAPESYALMVAPTELPDGTSVPYGLGIGLLEIRGRRAIGHAGGIYGFSSDSAYLPDENLFVAALANSDSPPMPLDVLLRRLAGWALDEPYAYLPARDVDPAALNALFGEYAGEMTVRFYAEDGKLYAQPGGRPAIEAFAAGDDQFSFGPGRLTWFEIERAADGAHVMTVHTPDTSEPERYVRKADGRGVPLAEG